MYSEKNTLRTLSVEKTGLNKHTYDLKHCSVPCLSSCWALFKTEITSLIIRFQAHNFHIAHTHEYVVKINVQYFS